jgi:cytochrome c-type biogenesis protein
MLESFFLMVNEWMGSGTAIAALGCLFWGMISVVFSPCHLASIPLIVAYVGGQQQTLRPREAGVYSVAFTSGLFITIALIGIICALLGRMLGDVGNYWQVLVGVVLIWVALSMFGVQRCSMSGSLFYRLNL